MIRCDHAGKYVCCADCGHSEDHTEFNDCATSPVSCAALLHEFGESVAVICKPINEKEGEQP